MPAATNRPELDSCYIYCFNQEVGDAVDNVKKGLEAEGLTGLAEFVECKTEERVKKSIPRRKKYREMDIFLPKVLHKRGRSWDMLNYERDILSAIDWSQLGAVGTGKFRRQGTPTRNPCYYPFARP